MSERFRPRDLKRDRSADIKLGRDPVFKPEPREQVVYRDGKPVNLKPLPCRLHGEPWQTCSKCSKAKR